MYSQVDKVRRFTSGLGMDGGTLVWMWYELVFLTGLGS